MPTSRKAKILLLGAIPPNHAGKIIELGSGWGTLLFPLAKQHPHSMIIGYELSPIPYLFSKLRHYLEPMPNIKIYRKDFFQIFLNDASI
ncbi:MAG TPA: SAM-dependent methyltransferase, partial [Waddliaceae bacterium]